MNDFVKIIHGLVAKFLLLVTVYVLSMGTVFAQEPQTKPKNIAEELFGKPIDISKLSSVLFTRDEYREILNAKAAIGSQDAASLSALTLYDSPAEELEPGNRFIHLQGILYTSDNDWVVWLNGQKVRPNALPEEALGFKVHKDFIEVRWFDAYTNQIIPVRLKPMQRFNIDSRVFLPG